MCRAAGQRVGRLASAGPESDGGTKAAGGSADCGAGGYPESGGGTKAAGGSADCGAGGGQVGAKTEYGQISWVGSSMTGAHLVHDYDTERPFSFEMTLTSGCLSSIVRDASFWPNLCKIGARMRCLSPKHGSRTHVRHYARLSLVAPTAPGTGACVSGGRLWPPFAWPNISAAGGAAPARRGGKNDLVVTAEIIGKGMSGGAGLVRAEAAPPPARIGIAAGLGGAGGAPLRAARRTYLVEGGRIFH